MAAFLPGAAGAARVQGRFRGGGAAAWALADRTGFVGCTRQTHRIHAGRPCRRGGSVGATFRAAVPRIGGPASTRRRAGLGRRAQTLAGLGQGARSGVQQDTAQGGAADCRSIRLRRARQCIGSGIAAGGVAPGVVRGGRRPPDTPSPEVPGSPGGASRAGAAVCGCAPARNLAVPAAHGAPKPRFDRRVCGA